MQDDTIEEPRPTDLAHAGGQENWRARRKARRKLWLDIHLYLGLVLGAVLAVIGLTGSVLVFWNEIDELMYPDTFTSVPPTEGEAAFQPLDEIRTAIEATLPAGAISGGFSAPRSETGCYKVYYTEPKSGDVRRFCVDPYTAKVLGDQIYHSKRSPLEHSFMSFMFQLHWSLLLSDLANDNGVVVGLVAIMLLASVVTGIVLWWPAPGKWIRALTFKRHASTERLNFDLHKLAGIYTGLVLLAVLVSGVSMNLHKQFTWVVERFAPLSPAERGDVTSEPADGRAPIGFDRAVAEAAGPYPDGRLASVGFPASETGIYTVCRKNIVELSRFIGTRCVLVDQYSGAVVGTRDPATGTAGDVFMQWQWPLHSGEAFGMTGRLLVFVTGLACPVLYVTGVIRWLQKRKAKTRARGKEATADRRAAPSGATGIPL
jgi:uncharacterized iron-regulated membrane protein